MFRKRERQELDRRATVIHILENPPPSTTYVMADGPLPHIAGMLSKHVPFPPEDVEWLFAYALRHPTYDLRPWGDGDLIIEHRMRLEWIISALLYLGDPETINQYKAALLSVRDPFFLADVSFTLAMEFDGVRQEPLNIQAEVDFFVNLLPIHESFFLMVDDFGSPNGVKEYYRRVAKDTTFRSMYLRVSGRSRGWLDSDGNFSEEPIEPSAEEQEVLRQERTRLLRMFAAEPKR